jgi:hypothetical protein
MKQGEFKIMAIKAIHHNDYEPVEGSMTGFLTAYCSHKTVQ